MLAGGGWRVLGEGGVSIGGGGWWDWRGVRERGGVGGAWVTGYVGWPVVAVGVWKGEGVRGRWSAGTGGKAGGQGR